MGRNKEKSIFKLNKKREANYTRRSLLDWKILLLLAITISLGFIGISFSKYKKTIDIGTINVTVDAAIELTYTLSTTDYTTNDIIIYVTPSHKKYKDYETYDEFVVTKPDGTTEEALGGNKIKYTVEKNGDYIFQAQNGLGDKCQLTIQINNIIEEKFSKIYQETTLYTDKNGDTAWIPEGFAVGITETIDEVKEGLVITDAVDGEGYSIGNEFVWIPVEVTSTDTVANIEAFYRSEWANNARSTDLTNSTTYVEPYTVNEWEVEQYELMKASVYNNGGFYIGRYEAGSTVARTKKANGTTEMVIQKDAYPYIYVSWGESDYTKEVTDEHGFNQGYGAVYLSKNLYENKDVGVISTLCYSVQWDSMLDFIKDEHHNVSQNNNWGNTKNNLWTIDRQTAGYSTDFGETWTNIPEEGKSKEAEQNILVTTGADDSFKAKNIYDICGNVFELTFEMKNNTFRVPRGNDYLDGLDGPTASYRAAYYSYGSSSFLGFRPALYITSGEKFSEIYDGTELYTDKNGETAWIPKGFAVGVTETNDEIEEGLVITDEVDDEGYSTGNEFVWIPVEVTNQDTATKIASFYRSEWKNNKRSTDLTNSISYKEPYTSNAWENEEYNDMLESVYSHGGFYIGRYEAGSQKNGIPIARINSSDGTSEVVVKRDQYPYIYVGWSSTFEDYTSDIGNQGKGAIYLSKTMYEGKDVGVCSTLCYGVQWDSMLDFIKDDIHNVTSSSNWGNYVDNAWTINRTKVKYYNYTTEKWTGISENGLSKTNSEGKLLTTGASKKCF